ncbi:MAG: nucleotidyltransferase [Coprobacillus sp.]
MRVLGIIVEYNPFHNGHIYHIQKAKELTQADYVIAVMSSSFVQRGEPAIIDKWNRSYIAVEHGVDLVVELPFVYACQSADYFAKGAIDLLNTIGVTDICFGSEDGNIDTFINIAKAIDTNQDTYNQSIKNYMSNGLRYPDACNQALKDILGQEIRTPNDLLGLSYVKEIIFHHYPITPHCFQRTNNYHGTEIKEIASATAIRKAIFNQEDYFQALPHHEKYQDDLYRLDDLYPYLRYTILTSSIKELQSFHLVEEGLENVLKKQIIKTNNMETLIQALLSKRYTRPRIQRMLIHILMKNTKQDIQDAMNINYLRILAMSQQGKQYLNIIKKNCPYQILTNFSKHHHPALDIEMKATQLLSLLSSDSNHIIKKEYRSIPYIKED